MWLRAEFPHIRWTELSYRKGTITTFIEIRDKHLKTRAKKWRQKPGKVTIFSLFYSQKVIFYFITRFYSSLLYSVQVNFIQCVVDCPNSQRPKLWHALQAVTSHSMHLQLIIIDVYLIDSSLKLWVWPGRLRFNQSFWFWHKPPFFWKSDDDKVPDRHFCCWTKEL